MTRRLLILNLSHLFHRSKKSELELRGKGGREARACEKQKEAYSLTCGHSQIVVFLHPPKSALHALILLLIQPTPIASRLLSRLSLHPVTQFCSLQEY